SYVIESMTNALEQQAEELLARIDAAGGTLAAIEGGIVQREIQAAAYAAQLAVDSGTSVVVGVNRYNPNPQFLSPNPLFQLDPEIERRQIERVQSVRASRSAEDWHRSLDAVSASARDGSNLLPPILAAVEARATVGEISDALRAAFGEYREAATW